MSKKNQIHSQSYVTAEGKTSILLGVKPGLGLTTSYVMVRLSGAPSLTTVLVDPLSIR